MKFTINWLKRHLDTDATAAQICEKLTAIGLEVEGFEDKAAAFAPFKVAYVEKAEKHPDADKLQVCTVRTDTGTIQVVCGAPNARTGMKAIFAPDGTYIPGLDVTLKKTKIRGVESNGMLVSEREMQLSDEHNGIIDVDPRFDVGTPMSEIFGLNEQLIEINLTPNRPDCAGMRGIARDLAAAGLGTLKQQSIEPVKGSFTSAIKVSIADTHGCKLFLGRHIKNIKNGPSPDWLQSLLKSVGLRPISALVDITNLMTLDQCRPLHVFDADLIKGDIVVREGKAGENFNGLNDKAYTLEGGEIAITDASGLLGLGGIVGGTSTGVSDGTVNVLLEGAFFDHLRIAKAGRAHGVISDARYRNERGIDPVFTYDGMEMATRLIIDLCGTDKTEVSEIVEAGTLPQWERSLPFTFSRVEKRTGLKIEQSAQQKILEDLGFKVSGETVTPPSWRPDVEGADDLVEEITRIVGLDKIEAVSVKRDRTTAQPAETLNLMRTRTARAAMTLQGMEECITWSFMPKNLARSFGSNDNPALTLSNPISADLDQMRPSIVPNLLDAARRNADRGFADVALCEVGPVFQSPKPDGQHIVATGLRAGFTAQRHWSGPQRSIDAYDVKADTYKVLEALGAPAANAQITREAPAYYHPGRSGALRLGKAVLAYFGEIHPAILEDMKIDGRAAAFEVFLQNIPAPKKKESSAKNLLKLSPFQPVKKDFAFIVKDSVAGEDILKAARASEKTLIASAEIFDVYKGKGVEDGYKSIAFTVTLQPQDATLTDEQIDAVMNNVINAVAEKTGGKLRA